MSNDIVLDLANNFEELHQHLADHLEDGSIDHPFMLIEQYDPRRNAIYNREYLRVLSGIESAYQRKDWDAFYNCIRRPHRISEFWYYSHKIEDDREYWTLLGFLWEDSESISDNIEEWWRDLLSSQRPHRDHIMSTDDRAKLAQLPDELTIYRGFSGDSDEYRLGWSWTLSRSKAEWFANRFGLFPNPTVLMATVAKRDVIAYFTDREEDEIVVDPDTVRITDEYEIARARVSDS